VSNIDITVQIKLCTRYTTVYYGHCELVPASVGTC